MADIPLTAREAQRLIGSASRDYLAARERRTKQLTYRHKQDRERAERYRAEVVELRRAVATHKADIAEAYQRGSRDTFHLIYRVLAEFHLVAWFNRSLDALDHGKRLPAMPPEAEERILDQIIAEKAARHGANLDIAELT